MTRPWNETKGDLRNEAAVANALVEHIPHYGGWFKNPLSIGMDVSMLDADKHLVNAFYEIKCRKASWTTYETVIIGKMHFIGHDQTHGFDRRIALDTDYSTGYDPDEYKLGYSWHQPSGGNPWGVDWMGPSYVKSEKWGHYPKHYDWDGQIHREALAYLSAKTPGCGPFFCCVSYHAPHNPFWIPDHLREPFRDSELPLPRIPEGMETCHGPMDQWLNDFHYEPEIHDRLMDKENLRWLYETYYGIVYDLDRRIGELIDLLGEKGLDKDTAIVFASDHGDMLAHRGMVQKRHLYERSVRVALLFSFPGHWKGGIRLHNPVSLIDLFVTFADMAGAPRPLDLPGRTLLPSVLDGVEPPPRAVFSEYHGEGVHAPCFMVRRDDFKYVHVHGYEERLYNVAEDPDEFTNLIGDAKYAQVVSELRAALLEAFDPEAVAAKAVESQLNRGFIYNCALLGENKTRNANA